MAEKKKVNLNDPKQRTDYWTKYASDKILGAKIVKVEYFSSREAKESMWYNRPVVFLLDNGIWLYPMRDDEGNDGGAMACNEDIFPVLGVEDEK